MGPQRKSPGALLIAALAAVLIVGPAGAVGDPTVSVAFAGTGAGTIASQTPDNAINCASTSPSDPACSAAYPEGSPVELVAAPADGSYFAGWSGDCTGTAYVASFVMPATDMNCVAEFADGGGTQSGPVLTVTTSASDGYNFNPVCFVDHCTLADALANGAGKTIEFADGITTIHTGELDVNPALAMTVDGGSGVTLTNDAAGSPILSQSGGTLTLEHLTLTGSHARAIYQTAGGTLTLQDVTVSGNSMSGGGQLAGGIMAAGTVTIVDSTITGNTASICGGADFAGTTTITNTDFTSNTASAIAGAACTSGTATMTGGRVSGNSAPGAGGIATGGTFTGNGTVFDGNSAFNTGAAFTAAQGGTATLTNATFFGNTLTSTIATDNSSSVKLVNATISANDQGVTGVVTLLNSILADTGSNCGPGVVSLGHNLDDAGTCGFAATGDVTGGANLADPTVDGLIKPLNGSPALDAGTSGTVGGLTVPATDAAGTARPQGGGVDIGAIERTEHKLTLKTAGTGTGTIVPDVAPSPSGWYVAGSTVHLTATPSGSSGFGSWSGDCVGASATIGVIVNADKTCTATFVAPPTIKSFAPAKGRIHSSVSITGTHFTGVTAVQFAGHDAASFKVVNDTKITAVVPDDAETGVVHVVNAAGGVDTVGSFTVTWIAPKPASMKPAKAGAGFTVTLTGAGFLGASAVTFNGIAADSFAVVSDTKLTAVVPDTVGATGPVAVTTPGGTAQTKTSFTFVQKPIVGGFSPAGGGLGTGVTITGSRFTTAVYVTFGLTFAKFKVVSDTTITTTVPFGAVTDPITVTTMGGTDISASNFTVTYTTPAVSGFTPAKGKVGARVTITGSHFMGTSSVTFGGHAATFTLASDTKLVATVPSDAVSGLIAVTNPAGSGTSGKAFFVVP